MRFVINQGRRGRTALPPPVWRTRVVAAKAYLPPPIAAATGHGDVLQSLPGEYIYT